MGRRTIHGRGAKKRAPSTDVIGTFSGTSTPNLTGRILKNVKTDFGAKGDGVTDDTTAIQNALNAVDSNWALFFPTGIYKYTVKFQMYAKTTAILYGDGPHKTILLAANKDSSTLNFELCNNIEACDFALRCPTGDVRDNSNNSRRGMMLFNSDSITLRNIEVFNVEDAGFLIEEGSDNVLVDRCYVNHSWSDGFHITGSCANVTLRNCKALETGDDSFASVGYDPQSNTNIKYHNCLSLDGGARGFCFEGTIGGEALYCQIYRSAHAGAALDTPSSFLPNAVDNILIRDCYFDNCRTDQLTDHPVILLFAENKSVHNITIDRNKIYNARCAQGIRASGFSAPIDVTGSATNNIMVGGQLTTGISVGANASLSPRTGNTLNGAPAN